MIRYELARARIPTNRPTVRSVSGGDPKLKVALPPVAMPAESRAVALCQAETKVRDIERDSVTSKRDKRDMARDRQRRRTAKLKA